jgi:hypothetical protein
MTQLLPVYARKEPTQDPVVRLFGLTNKKDTVVYRDPACTQLFARIPWSHSGHPRRNSSRITLNCFRWKLNWVR